MQAMMSCSLKARTIKHLSLLRLRSANFVRAQVAPHAAEWGREFAHSSPQSAHTAPFTTESPLASPTLPLRAVVADGTRKYPGRVTARKRGGVFVEFGAECEGFLQLDSSNKSIRTGDSVLVYPIRKWFKRGAGRVDVVLQPSAQPRVPWDALPVDGTTAVSGHVVSMDHHAGVLVDIGSEMLGCISDAEVSQHAGQSLRAGSKVDVYVVNCDWKTSTIDLSLRPLLLSRTSFEALVCDGQTPYRGTVVKRTGSAYLVDVNSEALGFLPADEVEKELVEGQTLTVYVCRKHRKTKRVALTLHRNPRPLQRWEAIIADGVSPHEGRIVSKPPFGAFVDFGAEVVGLLPLAGAWGVGKEVIDKCDIGQQVTVYVVQKNLHAGKITVSMQRQADPLVPVSSLCADGVTPHRGVVLSDGPAGFFVNIGAQNCGVLHIAREHVPLLFEHTKSEFDDLALAPGRPVDVYVVRRNNASGKVELSLRPTPHPRLPMKEVKLHTKYEGTVYHVAFNEVLVDFGSEVSGMLPRSAAPELVRGRCVSVLPVGFDQQKGRFKLELSTNSSGGELQRDLMPGPATQTGRSESLVKWVVQCGGSAQDSAKVVCRATGRQASKIPLDGWAEVHSQDGQVYYWDLATGETTWQMPE